MKKAESRHELDDPAVYYLELDGSVSVQYASVYSYRVSGL